MKNRDFRWLLVLGCNLLLAWLTGLANHHLAGFNLTLYLGGLTVVYAALRLDRRHGLAAVFATGLAWDAGTPAPFGLSAALLGLGYAAIVAGRQRFPRDEPVFATVVTLLVNLGLFLALSFVFVGDNPRPAAAWLRLFADLVCSQLVLLLITPWFIALNARALQLARLHPETGRRLEPST